MKIEKECRMCKHTFTAEIQKYERIVVKCPRCKFPLTVINRGGYTVEFIDGHWDEEDIKGLDIQILAYFFI